MTKPGFCLPKAAVIGLALLMALSVFPVTAGAGGEVLLTLKAKDAVLAGPAVLRGEKACNIGKNGGTKEGTLTYSLSALPADGYYTLRIHYYSGSDDRTFDLTADGETTKLRCPSTGGFDKLGTIEIDLLLTKAGSLTVGSDWYGPDLLKIEILEPQIAETEKRVYSSPDEERIEKDGIALILDKNNGIWSFEAGEHRIVSEARAEVTLDGRAVASHDFAAHRIEREGDSVLFVHENHPAFPGKLTQLFRFDAEKNAVLTEVSISADAVLETNCIAPLAVYGDGVAVENGVFLSIPFDNDMWAEPSFTAVQKLSGKSLSHEAAALYNTETGAGLVVGSVEHGVWKTGIAADARFGKLEGLTVYGGASDENTHDNSPHGSLAGTEIKSPLIFVCAAEDWREGLALYGKANAEVVPPKQSVPDVPFGFNSWGVLQDKVSYSALLSVSDYVKNAFQDVWTADGSPVYINIDSFWDFITYNDPSCSLSTTDALRSFVKTCHDNGQKAGIYFTPFAAWQSDEKALKSAKVDGTKYTLYDAALKKSDGSGLYGKLDGGYALDPTHPATVKRFEDMLREFINLGFEYVKLDFMTHGALEGQHYAESVRTGMQAYAYGMEKIASICAGKMFVNLSIAPLFPYQYADGRRISCDAFSSLDNTRHVLSCLTAGFWEKAIYPYPDPDHLVVLGKDGAVDEGEARCRVTSGVIAGTSFLVGDDLSDAAKNPEKDRRLREMFANERIVAAAKLNRSFRPLRVTPGAKCAEEFFCADGDSLYLAAFNFGDGKKTETWELGDLLAGDRFDLVELWSGAESALTGTALSFEIAPRDAVLYRITPVKSGVGEESAQADTASSGAEPGPGDEAPAPPAAEGTEEPTDSGHRESTPLVPVILGAVFAALAVGALILFKKRGKRSR